jgi:hypothetical protein
MKKRRANIEISTLVKWLLLLLFLILVTVIIFKLRGTGDESVASLCERSGGMVGC